MRYASFMSIVVGVIMLLCTSAVAAQADNKLLSISLDSNASTPTITLKTESAVGYRYTVYDSFDPIRVVIDFPGMDVSQVQESQKLAGPNLQEVRVSSFDLESGKLGRVEILVSKATSYEVALNGVEFNVAFQKAAGQVASIGKKLAKPAPAVEKKPAKTAEAAPAVEKSTPSPVVKKTAPAAAVATKPVMTSAVGGINFSGIQNQQAIIKSTNMSRYQYFRLAGPARLVVDLYGTKPAFKQRSFAGDDAFERVRVGVYGDKTRFVFDAAGVSLPGFEVAQQDDAVVVDWSGNALPESSSTSTPVTPKAMKKQVKPVAKAAKGDPVAVEALDFDSNDGLSTFSISMSGHGQLIPAVQKGDIVQFGISNATIGRSLRRVVDASSFPSAVRLITPYIVQNKGVQDVRFAAELKGPVSYQVKQVGDKIQFVTEDGAFAEIAPPAHETVGIPVTASNQAPSQQELAETIQAVEQAPSSGSTITEEVAGATQSLRIADQPNVYTGEKITLEFADADIRQILQLIAEVSNLNILASDDVKGNITMRLHDVPWDQALELILETKDLGMVRKGNVVQVLPRSRIRSMEEAKLKARRTKEKLEDLATEVIMVSHADLANVAEPAAELLTERGKITQDARNKQIIVTDVPAAIEDVRQLVSILDTPERQVLIESRIVEASSNFARDLGVNWGYSYNQSKEFPQLNDAKLGLGGSFVLDPTSVAAGSSGLGSAFTFGRLGIDKSVLNLRISALETSGHGKVVSTPRVATLNGEAALISQGTKIPYQSISQNGTETKFENAELKLEVTPVINPDDSVILTIAASNSSVGATVPTGVGDAIAIDEKKAETKVLVRDGETTVIGGIFVEDERFSESGVPFLMHLPIIGNLAKSTTKSSERRELLIFISPTIIR